MDGRVKTAMQTENYREDSEYEKIERDAGKKMPVGWRLSIEDPIAPVHVRFHKTLRRGCSEIVALKPLNAQLLREYK